MTVNSPDESLEEGPQLILQSPGGHQEDKTCMGTGQRVGYGMQIHNFDMYANMHRRIHATEQGNNSRVVLKMEHHTHPVRCIAADKDQQL